MAVANYPERRQILRDWVDSAIVPFFGLHLRKNGAVYRWSPDAASVVFKAVGVSMSFWSGSSQTPSSVVCDRCGAECEVRLRNVLAGNGPCGACGKRVLPGASDLATVRPDLVDRLVNPGDAQRFSVQSNEKILVRCSRDLENGEPCSAQVWQAVYNLTRGQRAQCASHGGRRPTEEDGWVYAFSGEHKATGKVVMKPTGFAGGGHGLTKREKQHKKAIVALTRTGSFYFSEPGLAFGIEQADIKLLEGMGLLSRDIVRVRTRSDGTESITTHVETTDGYDYMVRVGDAGLWAFRDLLAQHPDQLSESASLDAHAEVDALVASLCHEYVCHT